MKRIYLFAFVLFIYTFLSCGATFNDVKRKIDYNFSKPDVSFILPDTLREISGLTIIDSTTFACIQDENGILFIYDVIKNEIKSQHKFHKDGDYEELARVGDKMYVLRSDGKIYKISNYLAEDLKIKEYDTEIPANNNEGLCYDETNNRLLVGCKGKFGKESKHKSKRAIYAFDLEENKLSGKPVFKFDIHEIEDYIVEHAIKIPQKASQTDQEPSIEFMTSAISIHPITKQLYLLSAKDHLLFIIEPDGSIYHIEPLDPILFNKPEGITFFDNGDMLISNEGQDKKPTLLRFGYGKVYK